MIDIYKASAGSGKTYTLAREYILMMLRDYRSHRSFDLPHRHILAVTFTKKATAEMKDRILKELHQLATNPQESNYINDFTKDQSLSMTLEEIQQTAQTLLIGILQDYSSFAVSTIDGFFQQVVRRFARELGLNAIYDLTLDSDEVIEMAIDSLLDKTRRQGDKQVSEWLTDFAIHNMADDRNWNPKKEILSFSKQLMQEQLREQLPLVQQFFANKELMKSYRNQLIAICDEYEKANGVPSNYTRTKKNPSPELVNYLTAQHILDNLYPLGLLQDVAQEIEHTNQRLNRLPLAEINGMLTELIDDSDTPFIYEKLGQWLHHYLIDEFQDTSTLQWRNFRPLIAESESHKQQNLIVGDVKQSIYRWRNSNWHLLEQIDRHFSDTRQPPMRHNFRSSTTLVEANNDLFALYRDYVASTLDNLFPLRPELGQEVRNIYADDRLKQIPTKSFSGYMECRFFEGKANEVNEQCLDAILPVLQSIAQRGGKMGQVAIIVRKGIEAQKTAAFLANNGYSVQSADGLLIDNDPSVQLLLALLERSTDKNKDTEGTILHAQLGQLLPFPIDETTDEKLSQLAEKPVYEHIQSLIQLYHLDEREESAAYLTSFLDKVFAFTQTRGADTQMFLDHWKRYRTKYSVPEAPSADTIKILTIHSSKGLEFDFVIIPMLTWPVGAGVQENIIWCRPKEAPFATLPLVPISAKKELVNTHFREDYEEEMLNTYIDNLNMTYVAFTRAKHELYAFGGAAAAKKDGTYSIRTIGNLLFQIYHSQLDPEFTLKIGEKKTYTAEEKISTAEKMTNQYVYSPAYPRLQLRRHQGETTLLGNRMHNLLSRIKTWQDYDRAIKDMLSEGVINMQQIGETAQLFADFRQMCAGKTWFDEEQQIMVEEDILTPSGDTFRPDRVVINGQKATVIDYKFGQEKKLRAYQQQVKHYMSLLQEMGYKEVEGYIVYVALKEIEPVS